MGIVQLILLNPNVLRGEYTSSIHYSIQLVIIADDWL